MTNFPPLYCWSTHTTVVASHFLVFVLTISCNVCYLSFFPHRCTFIIKLYMSWVNYNPIGVFTLRPNLWLLLAQHFHSKSIRCAVFVNLLKIVNTTKWKLRITLRLYKIIELLKARLTINCFDLKIVHLTSFRMSIHLPGNHISCCC